MKYIIIFMKWSRIHSLVYLNSESEKLEVFEKLFEDGNLNELLTRYILPSSYSYYENRA